MFNPLAKLSEEMGELQQVIGKMLAYGTELNDPRNRERFYEEFADVRAAMEFIEKEMLLDETKIQQRVDQKVLKFRRLANEARDDGA